MTQLDLTLFGSFGAAVSGERITQFRTDKMRALLAYLAMNEARPFHRDVLATLLWSEWSDADARRNLRQTLHRLSQMLDQAAPSLGSAFFMTTRQTVQLNRSAVTLDVAQFRACLEAVEKHAHASLYQCDYCLEQMQQGAALYQGDLLEGFAVRDAYPFEEWLLVQREQLHQQVLDLYDKLATVFEQRGEFVKSQRFANRQVIMAPWRESAHRQLMRLYMVQGKRGDALAQYESCRELLAEELGVEPSAETTTLWEQIKEGNFQAVETAEPPPSGFPTQLTPFVGRQREVAEIMENLADEACRLLTLIGPGGIGKSRLSIEVGQKAGKERARYRDGAYFVPLVSVTSVPMLVNAIAQAFGIWLADPMPPKEQLLAYLKDKALLLVCDNFEQVENGASLLAEILTHSPGVQLLVTSQQPLSLTAEWRQVISGLDYSQGEKSEAALFFSRSAQRTAPHFRLNEQNREAVAALCRLVDGMPLALEIAAAWTRLMDCDTILQETQHSLSFLTSPLGDLPDRHRSVEAVLAQSWQMLTERLQTILGQMALFGGSFTFEAVRTIVADITTLDMATLMDKSLLRWRPNGRYQMHELLRHFVRSRPFIEPKEFRENYGRYYLNFAAEQGKRLKSEHSAQAIAAVQEELDNVRLAWRWAIELGAAELLDGALDGVLAYYEFRGMYEEGRSQFAAAKASSHGPLANRLRLAEASCLQRLGDLSGAAVIVETVLAAEMPETRLPAMIAMARLYEQGSQYDAAVGILREALKLAEPESREAAKIWSILGSVYGYRGPMEQRLAAHKQALAINVALDDRLQTADCHDMLSMIYKDLGEYEQAIEHIDQALAIVEGMNHRERIGQFIQRKGMIYWRQDDLEQAQRHYEQALAIATEINHKRLISICSGSLGVLAKRRRQYDLALRYYWRAVQLAKQVGDRSIEAVYTGNIGNAYMDLGEYEWAVDHLKQAAELDRALGALGGVARHHGNMGDALKFQGRFEEALPYFEEALPHLRETGAKYFLCWVLVSYAECLFEVGRLAEARAANEEGGRLAAEIGRDFYAFLSMLLAVRMDAVGADLDSIVPRLEALRERFDDLEMCTEVNYVLWKLTGDAAVRVSAEAGFRQLYAETGRVRFRDRFG